MRKGSCFRDRKTAGRSLLLILLGCATILVLCSAFAPAQFGGGFLAPSDAMDTLSGSSTGSAVGTFGPGGPFGGGQPGGPPGGRFAAPGGQGRGGYGMGSPGRGRGSYGYGRGMGRGRARRGGQPVRQVPLFPKTKTYAAYKGQRIYDAVSYRRNPNEPEILETVRRIDITDEETDQFSDDGETLGDYEANDSVYAQILSPSVDEYIGGKSRWALERNLDLLGTTQQLDPLDFFGLVALTTDRFSNLPKLRDHIIQRDQWVHHVDEEGDFSGWSNAYLKVFRIEQPNPNSQFFPLYVPKPPAPPVGDPPPAPWKPFNAPSLVPEEGAPGAAGARGRGGPGGMGGPGGYYRGRPGDLVRNPGMARR